MPKTGMFSLKQMGKNRIGGGLSQKQEQNFKNFWSSLLVSITS
ncbi:MAG: hypothetical protein WAM73_12555 [Desulfobacterales bacterium]